MQRKRRLISTRLGVVVSLGAIVSTTAGTAAAAPIARADRNASNVTLTWWVPGPSPVASTLPDAAAAFTKQTGIKVNVDTTPWSTYFTKLTTAITSGQGPDVAEIGNTWASTFADTGGWASWTPSMFKAIGGKSKFIKTSMSVTGAPGKAPVSVPFLGQSWLMEYNKALFKKAGIASPPTTWSSFLADAKKLTNSAKGIYGVAAPIGAPSADATWDWIMDRQYGGNYYGSNGQPDLTSKADVNSLTSTIDWVYPDKIINPSVAVDSTGTLDTTQFEEGKAGMLFTQDPQNAIQDPSKYGIGYIPLPSPMPKGGASIMSHVAGENLSIFKDSKHMAQDLEFVKFLTSPAEQETINKAMFELPVTSAGLKTPYFQTPVEKIFGKILADHAAPMPTNATSGTLQTDIGNATVQLIRKDIGAKSISTSAVRSSLSTVETTVEASAG